MDTRTVLPRLWHCPVATTLFVALALALTCSCINSRTERGVEPLWNEVGPEAFEPGRTTRGDVLDLLGPPSQILSLSEGSAFYYMLERTHSKGLILGVYNRRSEQSTYDRAVFFFDQQELLSDYSLSAARR